MRINVKPTNHEGIHKILFELIDRRVEIKKMCQSLLLIRNRENFTLCQENVWASSKFTLQKYIAQFLFYREGGLPIKTALKFQYYPIVNKVKYLLLKLPTVEKLITSNIMNKSFFFAQIWWVLLKGNVRY